MAANTSPPQAVPARPAVPRPSRDRVLFADIARSEATKLRSLRSTYWTLLSAAAAMIGFGALLTAAYVRHYSAASPAAKAGFDPAAYSLSGFFLAQLAIGVLGVIVITGEYATGSIRSTLAAAPQRTTVLAAKATVFGIVAATCGITFSFAAFFIGQALLAHKHIATHLSAPGVLRSVIGAGLYLAVFGLLALGIGALIRRTAGGIAALIGLTVFLSVAVGALPASSRDAVTKYLPSAAGQAVMGRTKFTPPGPQLSPWAGFGIFCAYTAAALIAAAITVNCRDA